MRILSIIFIFFYSLFAEELLTNQNTQFRSIETSDTKTRLIPFDLYVGVDFLMFGSAREVIANSTGTKIYDYLAQDHYKLKGGIVVDNYNIYASLYTDRLRDTNLSLDARYYGGSVGIIVNDLSNPFVMEIADIIFIETFAGIESGVNIMFGTSNFYYAWHNEITAGLAFKPYIFENIEFNIRWIGGLTYWSMPVKATDTVSHGSFRYGFKFQFGL